MYGLSWVQSRAPCSARLRARFGGHARALVRFTSFEGGSGLFAAYTAAPAGAVIGFVLGAAMALGGQGERSFGALAIFLAGAAAIGSGASWYLFVKPTPLNPNGPPPLLAFEIRLLPGATLPAPPGKIEVHLDANGRITPGRLSADGFRHDRSQQVIAGSVEMKHRSDHRMLVLNRPGEVERIFHIHVGTQPEHTDEFGPWETVRYARDPGQDSVEVRPQRKRRNPLPHHMAGAGANA